MLAELNISDLGVIPQVSLLLGPGLTAVTGETGAGKTMVVTAIDLLMGGRADASMVRSGADEAVVEGRFVVSPTARDRAMSDPATADLFSELGLDDEVVVRRVVPTNGRSRAYINGQLATATILSSLGSFLVDLHGQHSHQSLLGTQVQRHLLDVYGKVNLAPLIEARSALGAIEAGLADLGGDIRERAREIDLYRFQVAELDAAAITDPNELASIGPQEDLLAQASEHRAAGGQASELLSAEGELQELLGATMAALADRSPFADQYQRIRALQSEIADLSSELRSAVDQIDQDPERLAAVRARRQLLLETTRKYGETLDEVIAYHAEARDRLDQLESHDARAAELDARREAALVALDSVAAGIEAQRRKAAPKLAKAVEKHLDRLAMPNATFAVAIDGVAGDDVEFRLAANPGASPNSLAKVASGGELARTMLALRLVITSAPPTLIFDEVDAGIGGETAHALGRALGQLGTDHQVLVVTHLAQVAAFADRQFAVVKRNDKSSTTTTVVELDRDERVRELSRMLSGQPDSDIAHDHAVELLSTVAAERG